MQDWHHRAGRSEQVDETLETGNGVLPDVRSMAGEHDGDRPF